jgi:hypothetical protein
VIENRHLSDMKSTLPENSGRVSCVRQYKRFFGRFGFRNIRKRILTAF